MRLSFAFVATASLLVVTACGGDATGPANRDRATMSARIAGAEWSAMSIGIDSAPPSLLVVRGTNATATLTLVIPVAGGVGTQVVGGPTPMGAGVVIGAETWAASRTQGGSGSITLTTVAPGHVAGTFELTLAHEGASPAEQRITSGRFDVTYGDPGRARVRSAVMARSSVETLGKDLGQQPGEAGQNAVAVQRRLGGGDR